MPGPFSFAWAGGAVQDQVTLVTTGYTHGGVVETTAIVGDVEAGDVQIKGLAGNLAIGEEFFGVEGPGIAAGTVFINDTNISGPKDAINLSQPANASWKSATFRITKSIELETQVANFSVGSDVVTLAADSELLPGLYGVTGEVIGNYVRPDTGDPAAIGQAFLSYTGGAAASMFALVSVPDGDGTTGPITYTVEQVAVTATTTGAFPLRITGMPSGDWFTVTSIPAEHLASLAPGLVYNIAGNGIALGATFVAPASGTEITVDLPTSATGHAILTVTGPRTPDAPFDASVHNRFDEDIISVEIAQQEGAFATLTVSVKNPAVGLLAPGRNLWCWLSWDQAWPDGTPDLVPLFNGRLVGVPKLQAGEIVQLEFIARPDDFNVQKAALSESLQVLPYYDPVWLTQNINSDTVLETYSALWHIDRTSLELTTSDIIQGEDGIVEIGEDQSFYDNFSLSYGQPPLNSVTVSGTVTWQQQATGLLDVTGPLVDAFYSTGSPWPKPFAVKTDPTPEVLKGFEAGGTFAEPAWFGERSGLRGGGLPDGTLQPVQVTTGPGGGIPAGGGALIASVLDGMRNDWPKPGTNIGAGWSLSTRVDNEGTPVCFCHDATWLRPMSINVSYGQQVSNPALIQRDLRDVLVDELNTLFTPSDQLASQQVKQTNVAFPFIAVKVRMVLDYRADRKRTEEITAVLVGDVQRELSDSSESDREEISLTSQYVAQGVDAGGEIPIGNLSRRSYFQSDRGAQSLEYLLLAARAKIRARARAVEISFAVDWFTALGISLRNSVTYFDRRLPGGVATGKVKSYKLTAGATMFGEFVIGATIGNGEPSTVAIGVNSYVEDDYVDGYQVAAGGQIELLPAEIGYQSLDQFSIADDGLNLTGLTPENAVNFVQVTNGITDQSAALEGINNTVTFTNPQEVMGEMTTSVILDMKPLTGAEFHTRFFPAVTQLALPKTIDLAATAGS